MRSAALRTCKARIRGVAAVELAFLLIPLLLMIFGTTELGRAIYSYNSLDKAVRAATRHLSQHGPGDPIIAGEAECLAVYGKKNCISTDVPLVSGLTLSMVQICDSASTPLTAPWCIPYDYANQSTGLGSMNLIKVWIEGYPFNSAVQWVVPSLNFNNIAVTMRGI